MTKEPGSDPVLVTGATGFIGSRLVRRLVLEGRSVHIIIRKNSDISTLRDVKDRITVHLHDGTTDKMIHILNETDPNIVFHLASLFLSNHHPRQVTDLVESNIAFAVQLLEAISIKGSPDFINTGTSWQHYENRDYSPVNLYAATKQAFETILQYYAETVPLKAVTLKIGDTYGPGDHRPKVLNLLLDLLRSGGRLDMSPGEQVLDILHVDDIIEAYIHMAGQLSDLREGSVQTYALSSGEPVSLKNLVALFEKAAGRSLDINWGGRPYRKREIMEPWNTGEPLPGWKPAISLDEGIRDLLAQELIRE